MGCKALDKDGVDLQREIRSQYPFFKNRLFWSVLGIFLCLLSSFLPWATFIVFDLYLPWSLLLNLGRPPRYFPMKPAYLIIGITIRVAAGLGWAGFLSCIYKDRFRRLSTLLFLSSGAVSLASVIYFFILNNSVSWGFYSALVGGILTFSSALFDLLGIEIVLESEEEQPKN